VPAPAAGSSVAAAPDLDPEGGGAPFEVATGLSVLAIPPASSGQGILTVNATPWGLVRVNGHAVGDTPKSMRLPAGRHRVRIERKGHRAVDELVWVKPGERTRVLR
jgi:hypothetical protein